MRRIEIGTNSIILRLNRSSALNLWAAANPGEGARPEEEITDCRRRVALASGETLADHGHASLTLNLAFLSPAIIRAIVRDWQPPGLRLTHPLGAPILLSWREQEAMIGRTADASGR